MLKVENVICVQLYMELIWSAENRAFNDSLLCFKHLVTHSFQKRPPGISWKKMTKKFLKIHMKTAVSGTLF